MSKRLSRVIVVGSVNTDLVVRCGCLPAPGETVLGGNLQTYPGGKGANQAVAAARAAGAAGAAGTGGTKKARAEVRFLGAFGDDAFGKARRVDLEKEGVDCSGCVVKKNTPSGAALIAVGATGKGGKKAKAENLIVVAPGANAALTPTDVKRGLPKDLDVEDVVLVSVEIPLPAVARALETGLRKGAFTVLNPAPYPPKGLPAALLRLARVLTPNETEWAMLSGGAKTSAARRKFPRRLMSDGPAHVIITRGAAGVRCCSRGLRCTDEELKAAEEKPDGGPLIFTSPPPGKPVLFVEDTPAPRVKAVDTVGAGDCFNGALAAYLSSPRFRDTFDFGEAVRFATAAAALSVTRQGAQPGMPRRREIAALLRKMPPSKIRMEPF